MLSFDHFGEPNFSFGLIDVIIYGFVLVQIVKVEKNSNH